ncbi:dipeptidase [Inconstantimicrobium mannanitabidum]|uniref:Dipeptidase n=1 Tax=Inconstantimicrobium mannanitabidum TaxID=1604901 RepID=A0ACB5RAB4_9CLOT|nr:dipeptidase [Clostridium sp. TW13]GKX66055.1 dipeptidase [Clostridium sp. TW13]
MEFIDLHCDVPSRIYYENKQLRKNDFSVDIEKLKKGNAMAQFFAFFIESSKCKARDEFLKMYAKFMEEVNKNSEIALAKNIKDLYKNRNEGKISAFLTIEEGAVLDGNINNLYDAYEKGIRLITLTWNYENEIGYPSRNKNFINKGLKEFGIDLITEMNRLGIAIDVSHLSDGGFYDVIQNSKFPILASHSNSRSITNHPRNLTDEMIRLLGNNGGIMGLNYCAEFIGTKKITAIEDIVNHMQHIVNVGGEDIIALGSDFDGIENEVEINNPGEMYKLINALEQKGYKEDFIEKLFYKNSERFIKDTLK